LSCNIAPAQDCCRCLIPADGFYEWRTTGGTKIHFTLGMKDDRPFAFPGVWDGCKDSAATEWLRKIITGQSTGMRANAFSRFSKTRLKLAGKKPMLLIAIMIKMIHNRIS
jgi:putative SOS response-associated peptidase YedK